VSNANAGARHCPAAGASDEPQRLVLAHVRVFPVRRPDRGMRSPARHRSHPTSRRLAIRAPRVDGTGACKHV